MTYKEFIQNIIDTRGQWNIPEGQYFEKHHILAACLGGTGDGIGNKGRSYFKKNSRHPNCIYLYADEHFIAHFLLVRENPKQVRLLYPLILMANYSKVDENQAFNLIDENLEHLSKEYKKYKEEYHSTISGINNPNYGKPLSDETKLKISVNRTGKGAGENHWTYHKSIPVETREKIRKTLTGKTLEDFPLDVLNKIMAPIPKDILEKYKIYCRPYASASNTAGGKNGHATMYYIYDGIIFNCRDDFIYYINNNVDKKLTESVIRRVQNGSATFRAYREHMEVFNNVKWGLKNENKIH